MIFHIKNAFSLKLKYANIFCGFAVFFVCLAVFYGPVYALNVAVINFKPVFGDTAINGRKLLTLNEEAALNGAELIVNSELSLVGGYWGSGKETAAIKKSIQDSSETVPGATTSLFGAVAARYHIYIVVGLVEYDLSDGCFYNTAVLLGPDGTVIGKKRKTTLVGFSKRIFKAGKADSGVFETGIGKIMLLICADAMSGNIPDQSGPAFIMTVPVWFGGNVHLEALQRTSRSKKVYLIAANGSSGGDSVVIDPLGNILLRVSRADTIGYADIPAFTGSLPSLRKKVPRAGESDRYQSVLKD